MFWLGQTSLTGGGFTPSSEVGGDTGTQDVDSLALTGSGEENIKVAGAMYDRRELCATARRLAEPGMEALKRHRPQLQRRHEQSSASST